MSKRTEHIHLRVTPAMKRDMRKEAKGRGKTVNSLAIEIIAAALGTTET
jgi:predicted HicB family RNase H-like nuclease